MEIRVVLKRLVPAAVAHVGEEIAALERIVGNLDKQQRDGVHGRWPEGERWFALPKCFAALGKDESRVRWPAATLACNGKGF